MTMPLASSPFVLLAFSPARSGRVLETGAYLERFGFEVGTAQSFDEALSILGRAPCFAVVFDLALAADVGLDTWLGKVKLLSPGTLPIAIGGVERLDDLRRVIQRWDGDYVLEPADLAELRTRLRRTSGPITVTAKPSAPAVAEADAALADLVGQSVEMERIRDRIRKVAGLTSTVLITGESGVGKELIARALHRVSPRREQAFIAINCSALPENLLESELFGHERGAFTGAVGTVKGKFELAHRGTLFLDEIGDMNPYTQAKILRVLEEREFMRVGGDRNIRVEVRLVAATNADLPQRMASGQFREDLYYRLKVLTIEVPPLRTRPDDVPLLSRAFVDRFSKANGLPPVRFTDEAMMRLQAYRWPGNIRELRNTLENLVVTVPGNVIDVEDLPDVIRGAEAGASAPSPSAGRSLGKEKPVGSLEEMERQLIGDVLRRVDGNRTHAARILRIGVRTLQRKLKRYGLEEVGGG